MAPMSSGQRLVPGKQRKGGTSSTRKHQFESFNQRIAKLNIDPIRQTRRNNAEEESLDSKTSYFRTNLDRWKELNLSETFANFVKEVEALCVTLPQVLHYNHIIMSKLIKYVQKKDVHSLEPLLELMASFAHDLGARFEPHFNEAVLLVASTVAGHVDIQVLEWSFSCLAWLFKYLSRLLVPDLRPLFRIMAPLLGKEPQKPHIAKFTAEALSFLVRKAALRFRTDQVPLMNIIRCILDDVESAQNEIKNLDLYHRGLMTLFFDSMKSIERKISSYGDIIYRCLLDSIAEKPSTPSSAGLSILSSITVALMHHTDAETFVPILRVILENIQNRDFQTVNDNQIFLYSHLLSITILVRKGSRIQDWSALISALRTLLDGCNGSDNEDAPEVIQTAAMVLQSAPMDIAVANVDAIINIIFRDQNMKYFVPFCYYFRHSGRDRFRTLIYPYFAK